MSCVCAVVGNEDFALKDIMSSEYDLKFASKNFKFALVPKVSHHHHLYYSLAHSLTHSLTLSQVSSELVAVDNTELLAHDEVSYNQWISALSTVIKYSLTHSLTRTH